MTAFSSTAFGLGGKAAILAMLTATASVAQTARTDAPIAGMTTMEAIEFPTLPQNPTDQQVIDSLSAQGYEHLVVVRANDMLIVTGERGGLPTEMMFSGTDGTLLSVDGIEPVTDSAGD